MRTGGRVKGAKRGEDFGWEKGEGLWLGKGRRVMCGNREELRVERRVKGGEKGEGLIVGK